MPESTPEDDIDQLFGEALDLRPSERERFLRRIGATNKPLRDRLERLLIIAEQDEGFLGGSPLICATKAATDALVIEETGALIGPFRLVRRLGAGGMGEVYLAERIEGGFRQHVALKLVRADGRNRPERFDAERQILAELDHPGIARLYDGGLNTDGRQYMAMEYVEGADLLAHCAARRAALAERLNLFLQVCEAVTYAHAHLVVHRDLKPANIFVTAAGQVKLLDFGIAKLLLPNAMSHVTHTAHLSPAYAAPEQLTGGAVTTSTDVYALGVTLFELLSERLPWPASSVPLSTAIHRLLDEAPPQLSAVTPPDGPVPVKQLRGDLDAIVAKAMRKEPASRYPDARALADDLNRHLQRQPVEARAGARAYVLRRFLRRHWLPLAAAAAVFVALGSGIAVALWEAARAEREAARADAQSATANAVSDFLQNDLLAQASSLAQAGSTTRADPGLTVRAALDRAAERIDGKFGDQPALEASIRQTIGNTYRELALYAEAQQQMEKALALRQRVLGVEHADTLSSMRQLGALYASQGKNAPAESLLTKVLEQQRRLIGEDHQDALETMNYLAVAVSAQGRHAEAEALFLRVLRGERHLLGDEHPATLGVMNNLVSMYINQGQYARAEELGGKLVAIRRRVLGDEHPSTLMSMNNLGVIDRNLGKYAEAEMLLSSSLDGRRRVFGADHPLTLASVTSLALLYQAQEKYAQAEPLLLQGLEARRRVLGADHPQTAAIMNNLAELYRREGKQKDAENLFTQVLDLRRRLLGPDHPNTASVLTSLAGIKLAQHKYAEAEVLLRQALTGYEKSSPDNWQRYYAQSMLGASLAGRGNDPDAEPLLRSGYEGMVQRQSSIPVENRSILDEVKGWIDLLPHRSISER